MSKQKEPKKAKVLKPVAYMRFIEWVATPEPLREPKTQIELAKVLKVNDSTLSDWKKIDTFWLDVEERIKSWMQDKTPNVMGKLYAQIMKEGKAQEVKLWLQYGVGFSEKVQVEDKALAKVFSIEKMLRKIAGAKD